MSVCRLTQVNAIQVGASLLCHIHVHVEEDHRVSKVFPGAGIQDQHGVVGRGGGKSLLVSVGALPAVQHLADAETSPRFGAHHPT